MFERKRVSASGNGPGVRFFGLIILSKPSDCKAQIVFGHKPIQFLVVPITDNSDYRECVPVIG